MRKQRFGHRLAAGLVVGAILGIVAPVAFAQNQAVITGRVTSDRGDALGGATVVVNNTNFGAATNTSGVYQITIGAGSARGQTVTITARALGYKPVSREVQLTVGTQEQNFELATDPLRLDELVVTGVSEATSTRKLTFTVGRVSEDQLQVAPGTTALGALQGKVAGVSVFAANGMPGTAPLIKLRGATSITGTQNPLIIVDGTLTQYSLADIASEDIERVEVVKGAAASSLYGSQGANGVIQIFTRRGANLPEGKLQVTARFEGGKSFITRRPPVTQHHAYVLLDNGDFYRRVWKNDSARVLASNCDDTDDAAFLPGGVCPAKIDIQDKPYPVYSRAADELYESGDFFTQYISVGQNRGPTNFNVSFSNTMQAGSIFNLNGLRRQNFRVNLDQVLTDRLDLSINSFYGRSTNEEPSAGGDNGPFFSIAFLEPHVDPTICCNPDGTPFKAFIRDKRSNAANPLYDLFAVQRDRTRSRVSGGGRLRWRPFSWLNAEGNFNFDQLNSEFEEVEPVKYWNATGTFAEGNYERETLNNRTYNAGATLTGIWRVNGDGLMRNLGITLKGAYVYEDQVDHFLRATASSFVVADVPEFPGTDPSGQRATSDDASIRNRNVFAVGTLDFDEKVILDGLIRRDGSSLFGPDARWATYWRGSGALRVPQLLGWTAGPEEWRLRVSYGTAGLRPPFEAQYEVLEPSTGVFIKTQLGNRNLRPAKSEEFEVGTNLELAGGRVTIEYNYSDKETRDQIILAPLLATTGFTRQWQNVGALEAKTHELAIGAQVINTRDMALQVNLTGDRTREYITDWPLPDNIFSDLGDFGGFTFAPGTRLGTMRGQKWVRALDQLYLDPAKQALSGPGQTWSSDSVVVNFDGYLVKKSLRGTPGERPIPLIECVAFEGSTCVETTNIFELGVSAPDFRVGMNTNFSYRRFNVTGLLDWSQGGEIYNGTAHWATQDCADIRCDQSAKPEGDRIAEGFYNAGLYNGANANEAFVEDATFLKLRELSVSYTFNQGQLGRVGLGRLFHELRLGLIGRNLFTWTGYGGIDPEVAPAVGETGITASPFRTRADWFQYPPFRTFTGFVEIAF